MCYFQFLNSPTNVGFILIYLPVSFFFPRGNLGAPLQVRFSSNVRVLHSQFLHNHNQVCLPSSLQHTHKTHTISFLTLCYSPSLSLSLSLCNHRSALLPSPQMRPTLKSSTNSSSPVEASRTSVAGWRS